MKQKTFIVIGLLIVSLLVAVWLYLLFFGTPENPEDVFTDLGFSGEEDGGTIIPPTATTTEVVVNQERPRLRQLTTKPVIGFMEVQQNESAPLEIYYAEAGTGHIYAIDSSTGVEARLSNTTIPEASYASFSPSGQYVALRSKNTRHTGPLILGELDLAQNSLETKTLVEEVIDFSIINDDELFYAIRDTSGLVNRVYYLETGTSKNSFTVPFFDATIQWAKTATGTHYVYPKPTYLLEGYLYAFLNGTMRRTVVSGFGLTALANSEFIFYTNIKKYQPQSAVLTVTGTETRAMNQLLALPEKCAVSSKSPQTFWCGYEGGEQALEFPDNWYRGVTTYKDAIWKVDAEYLDAELLVDTYVESSREIDITRMTVGSSETALYFINKNDNTLWMYEL